MRLSIVTPAYNERHRLPPTLRAIAKFFEASPALLLEEVIVVDDGSDDGMADILGKEANHLPARMFRLPQNRGKGAALRRGVQEACGDFVLLYDADAATPIGEVVKLIDVLHGESADIAIGSRMAVDSDRIVTMGGCRRLIGWIYHALC